MGHGKTFCERAETSLLVPRHTFRKLGDDATQERTLHRETSTAIKEYRNHSWRAAFTDYPCIRATSLRVGYSEMFARIALLRGRRLSDIVGAPTCSGSSTIYTTCSTQNQRCTPILKRQRWNSTIGVVMNRPRYAVSWRIDSRTADQAPRTRDGTRDSPCLWWTYTYHTSHC